jgi:hypothetical protein
MSATRAERQELPCGFADPTRHVGDGNFCRVSSGCHGGAFVFRMATVGARQGSYGQNAENNRGGIFGMEVGLTIEVLLMNGARWVGLS